MFNNYFILQFIFEINDFSFKSKRMNLRPSWKREDKHGKQILDIENWVPFSPFNELQLKAVKYNWLFHRKNGVENFKETNSKKERSGGYTIRRQKDIRFLC